MASGGVSSACLGTSMVSRALSAFLANWAKLPAKDSTALVQHVKRPEPRQMQPAERRQPLASHHAVGRLPGLKEPRLLKGSDQRLWLLWLEQRPQERGRTTALIRPFADCAAEPVELTPAPINLRSRVHDYGGGVLASAMEHGELLLVWIAAGCLWQQRWHLPDGSRAAAAVMEPLRLTLPGEWDLADGLLDLRHIV